MFERFVILPPHPWVPFMVIASGENSLLPGARLIRALQGHLGAVHGIAWTPDGRRLVTASYDCSVKVWDLDTGKEVGSFQGHGKPFLGVAVLPDGRHAVSVSSDHELIMFNINKCNVIKNIKI